MILTQELLDTIATQYMEGQGTLVETVDFYQKETADGDTTLYEDVTPVRLEAFKSWPLTGRGPGLIRDGYTILWVDKILRVQPTLLAFVPTVYTEVVRQLDGSRWKVVSHTGGVGHMWYLIQMRQIA